MNPGLGPKARLALGIACARCGVQPGERCVNRTGAPHVAFFHDVRYRQALLRAEGPALELPAERGDWGSWPLERLYRRWWR